MLMTIPVLYDTAQIALTFIAIQTIKFKVNELNINRNYLHFFTFFPHTGKQSKENSTKGIYNKSVSRAFLPHRPSFKTLLVELRSSTPCVVIRTMGKKIFPPSE